jgi:hypothetical protein
MKQRFNLNPKDINQPIQLLGASLIGAVFLVGEFLYASTKCPSQIMAWFFGITAILIFPLILYFIFILQTKYRIELQGDKYFNEAMKRKYQRELMESEKTNLGEIEKWIKEK